MDYNKKSIKNIVNISDLISFCLEQIPSMVTGDQLCFEKIKDNGISGSSLRYTIISLIGLSKARKHGYRIPIDTQRMYQKVINALESINPGIGDIGLLLWLDSRMGNEHSEKLIERLNAIPLKKDTLRSAVGMEIAWLVIGTAYYFERTGDTKARKYFSEALTCLLDDLATSSGLFRHYGERLNRARFPNFATQIYCILALTIVAGLLNDEQSLRVAEIAADKIISLQLDDGGWPWLFDAQTGNVVERYELYSVHQDAMTPMALLELFEVTGKSKYALSAYKGLEWIYGNNELSRNMCDETAGLIYRSIRRKVPANRFFLYFNTISSIIFNQSDFFPGYAIDVNKTSRPYHLGWILEAWCGRENLIK